MIVTVLQNISEASLNLREWMIAKVPHLQQAQGLEPTSLLTVMKEYFEYVVTFNLPAF